MDLAENNSGITFSMPASMFSVTEMETGVI